MFRWRRVNYDRCDPSLNSPGESLDIFVRNTSTYLSHPYNMSVYNIVTPGILYNNSKSP